MLFYDLYSLKIADGAFVVVIGAVGTGKSTFLAGLIGELQSAGVFLDGSLGFVGQQV